MAQFSSSKTTGGGVIVNSVVTPSSDTVTYTVTAPNGAVATATQNASGGLNPATLASIQKQLVNGGAEARTFSIGLTTALSTTTANANEQAAAAPAGVQETQSIPVSTVTNPQVPQPTNNVPPATTNSPATSNQQLAAVNAAQVANGGPDATAASNDPAVQAEITRIRQATGQLPQNTAPQPFNTNQDEFGNLGAAQAAAAETETAINNPALVTDENEVLRAAAAEADTVVAENNQTVDDQDPFEAARLRAIEEEDNEPRVFTAEDLAVDPLSDEAILAQQEQQALNRAALQSEDRTDAAATAAAATRAKNQSTLQTRQNQPAAADWRVRLRLAPNADYLYKVNDKNGGAGILAPLAVTDGVVFPYTPVIETSYQAKYDSYDLTHSNYRGYFYKNSTVENITIKGTFTAQDTREAQYLLAVIHFFKSVTKMFYGQDQQAGTPPPLVYLSGFGKYQFNENPCVVTNFGYSLPNDVDYIRADGFNNIGLNMGNRRSQSSGPAIGGSLGTAIAIIDRLTNAGFENGSLTNRPNPGQVNQNVANQTSINSTYVPTKMEISITLLPMQTRNQVSKQFSLKSFANGSLLAGGGFW
jgi:hypothetical protein